MVVHLQLLPLRKVMMQLSPASWRLCYDLNGDCKEMNKPLVQPVDNTSRRTDQKQTNFSMIANSYTRMQLRVYLVQDSVAVLANARSLGESDQGCWHVSPRN